MSAFWCNPATAESFCPCRGAYILSRNGVQNQPGMLFSFIRNRVQLGLESQCGSTHDNRALPNSVTLLQCNITFWGQTRPLMISERIVDHSESAADTAICAPAIGVVDGVIW